jgi:hypothetical protein
MKGLKDAWKVPRRLLLAADVVVDENGIHEKPGKK